MPELVNTTSPSLRAANNARCALTRRCCGTMSTAYMSTSKTRKTTSCTVAPPVGQARLALAGGRSRRGPHLLHVPAERLEALFDDGTAHPGDEIEHPRQVVQREQPPGRRLV